MARNYADQISFISTVIKKFFPPHASQHFLINACYLHIRASFPATFSPGFYWNHIRCDGITPYAYEKLCKLPQAELEKMTHFCKICKEDFIPFQKLSDEEFITSIIKNIDYKEDLNLRTCPPVGLKRLFTDFSNHNDR